MNTLTDCRGSRAPCSSIHLHTCTHTQMHVLDVVSPGRPGRYLSAGNKLQSSHEPPRGHNRAKVLRFPVNGPCPRAAVRCFSFLPLSSPSSRRGPPPRARCVQVSRGKRKTASAPVSISWQADGEGGGGGSEGEQERERGREGNSASGWGGGGGRRGR